MLIGRDNERKILQDALADEYSQFIAVYGRRRVGKTFLIRESYDYHFTFQFTGSAQTSARKQLARFRMALKEQGLADVPPVFSSWIVAFSELKRFISLQPEGKKIIFLDELPWMDAPRSGFLAELESFWNGWASARKDIVFVVCGSAKYRPPTFPSGHHEISISYRGNRYYYYMYIGRFPTSRERKVV
ncbi:MAG: ATP-binding protein [Prevotella sp.]|nr:ATP-binding protein [Prevotella sp.]